MILRSQAPDFEDDVISSFLSGAFDMATESFDAADWVLPFGILLQ